MGSAVEFQVLWGESRLVRGMEGSRWITGGLGEARGRIWDGFEGLKGLASGE